MEILLLREQFLSAALMITSLMNWTAEKEAGSWETGCSTHSLRPNFWKEKLASSTFFINKS